MPIEDQKEKRYKLSEVSDVEKQLWACVFSKGLLNSSVQKLYRKACKLYEKLFLSDAELEELQEIEFSLWKLHYKHIDEFRKRTSQGSGKEEIKQSTSPRNSIEGFELFLRESSKFYQDLINKIKSHFGIPDTTLFYNNTEGSGSISEQVKLRKCQFVCHRLLVCLGDLLRYLESEVYEKLGIQQRNWFSAANCYMEAAKIYPDGGNPHNQLSLLSIYTGDEFLALYHFVRSLAVKEPFPDAFNNLILLFERNRSTPIDSLSVSATFDFLRPLQRVCTSNYKRSSSNYALEGGILKAEEKGYSMESDTWPLILRTMGFFFLEFSLESFSNTFACTIRALEALLTLDDSDLVISLESYHNMNLSRSGPYRMIQLVCVLIFLINNPSDDTKLQPLKFSVMFIFMGRVIDRCLKSKSSSLSPLLPAVLVFSEWLVIGLLEMENLQVDDNLKSALYYLFSAFTELLNRLLEDEGQDKFQYQDDALWEDYEMRGFTPLSQFHSDISFTACTESEANFEAKNELRTQRIIQAATKISKRSCSNAQLWIFKEKGGKFSIKDTKELLQRKKVEDNNPSPRKFQSSEEEEDIIVFEPITRYNSEPISSYLPENVLAGQEELKGGSSSFSKLPSLSSASSDESLRRASSLLIAQNRALIDSLTSRPGPPSLSSWVLNGERPASSLSLSSTSSASSSFMENREDGRKYSEESLTSIKEESIPTSLNHNTIERSERENRFGLRSAGESASTSANFVSTSPLVSSYCAPIPSAPLLPEDAVWFSSGSPAHNPTPNFANYPPPLLQPSIASCTPPPRPWFPSPPKDNQTRNALNINNHGVQQNQLYFVPPHGLYPDASVSNNSNLYIQQPPRFDILNGWVRYYPLAPASPVIYSESTPPLLETSPSPFVPGFFDQRREMLFQRPCEYDGGNSYARAEQQRLLQYLKEKEWRIQQESSFVEPPTYTRI